MDRLPVVVFLAGAPPAASEPERWLAAAHLAAAQDLLARALADPVCGPCFVVGGDADVARSFAGWPVVVVPGLRPFHFGRALGDLARRERLEAVLYLSGGAGVLLPQGFVGAMAARLAPRRVVTNNRFSCDFAAFAPADALGQVRDLPRDNDLAWALAADAGFAVEELPREVATLYDLDSPLDLLVLRLAGQPGPVLARCLAALPGDDGWLRAAARPLARGTAEVTIAGRLATDTLAFLDREAACRKRALVEERGMEASRRAAGGAVRSLLGRLLEAIGPAAFFAQLSETSASAFVDTRVLLAHRGACLSPSERFAADLLWADALREPWLRALVEAARAAPLPVVLGGHTLLNGGLRLLVAWSWRAGSLTDRPAAQ